MSKARNTRIPLDGVIVEVASRSRHRAKTKRIFLLSPANLSGRRAEMLLGPNARCALALRLQGGGVPLGEVFSFVSGLYFRGKLAYATRFAEPVSGSVLVITACSGLLAPELGIDCEVLRQMAGESIHQTNLRYRDPLERDLKDLLAKLRKADEVVLLGSIATPKYLEPLSKILGGRLRFPAEFVGRGDMSRGALMLRAAREGKELTYVVASENPAAPQGATKAKTPSSKRRAISPQTTQKRAS
jgi:hypothetical protein